MARSNQYNPNRAGYDMLAFCQNARARLIAGLDAALPIEERVLAIVAIRNMDYNELLSAVN